MKNKRSLSMLDVENKQLDVRYKLSGSLSGVMVTSKKQKKAQREERLEKYTEFFKQNLSKIDDIENPNYIALEIANDEGLNVTEVLKKDNGSLNFKLCNIGLIETLLQNPAELKKINLVHAVLPFDDSALLIKDLLTIPEVSKASTRVVLGLYGDSQDLNYDHSERVLRSMIRNLDFFDYKGDEIDGTTVKMVWSTYQKNMRMRH